MFFIVNKYVPDNGFYVLNQKGRKHISILVIMKSLPPPPLPSPNQPTKQSKPKAFTNWYKKNNLSIFDQITEIFLQIHFMFLNLKRQDDCDKFFNFKLKSEGKIALLNRNTHIM